MGMNTIRVILFSLLISTCLNLHAQDANNNYESRTYKLPSVIAREFVQVKAISALAALRVLDVRALAILVHPIKGIRFIENTYVYKDLPVFTRNQILTAKYNSTKYTWGHDDDTGQPIKMTLVSYLKGIYNHDYVNAPYITFNHLAKESSIVDNTKKYFPGAIMVHFYFPGFDKNLDGMDWAALKLFFEQYQGTWYLVAIISEYLTI
jgi:hypothetical protein